MKKLLSSILAGFALTLFAAGSYRIGGLDAAHRLVPQAEPDTSCYVIAAHDSEANLVPVECPDTEPTFANALTVSPTAIVPPSRTATVTMTRTPTPAPSLAPTAVRTPTPQTGTPQPTQAYQGTCSLVAQGAERYEPKGMAWYAFTDAMNQGLVFQNIRSRPINGDIVGKLTVKYEEHLVYWQIMAGQQMWYALNEQCDQWVAGWLGFVNIHP